MAEIPNPRELVLKKNRYFVEATIFGKRRHKLVYSEKLEMYFIILENEDGTPIKFIFEDGVVYLPDEIKKIGNSDTPVNIIKAIHASKKVFGEVRIL